MNQKQLEQKATRYARKIIRLPFVRMVVLTGSVAAGRATHMSDIDFLIVTQPGRIYLTRAIVVIMANIWGEYRSNKNIAGKLCLNWWRTSLIQNSNLKSQNHNLKLKIDLEKADEIRILSQRTQESPVEKLLFGSFGDTLELLAKNYQIKRFQKDPRTHMHRSEVRWSDSEIGLHPPRV